jgi:H/ACA ribonucleoprotein complex subunit 4
MSEGYADPLGSEKKKKKKKDKTSIGEVQASTSFRVDPSSLDPRLADTANWPLLLKHYDKLNVRANHFTPLPFGYLSSNKLNNFMKS